MYMNNYLMRFRKKKKSLLLNAFQEKKNHYFLVVVVSKNALKKMILKEIAQVLLVQKNKIMLFYLLVFCGKE